MASASAPHSWKFFRTGGLDQVALESAADLLALEHLDPKLWVALSCPVKGLELDEATLKLIDADGDGRIRVPELLAAVRWAGARLRAPADLLQGAATLPLAAINDATPEGAALLGSARQILASLGRAGATEISVAETCDTAKIFSASPLNGDGVIPPDATDDPALQTLLRDILTCFGGTQDRTGAEGVTAAQIDGFFGALAAYAAWAEQSAAQENAVLGEGTAAAVAAVRAVRGKVDDYFARCRLAAFDPRITGALDRAESDYLALAARNLKLSAAELADFPLARIEPGRPLPLGAGLNPAWAASVATLCSAALVPVFGTAEATLTEADWLALNARLAPFEAWLGGKAGGPVERLGLARVRELLAGPARAALAELVARDRALEPYLQGITEVDRLVRYRRDLGTLLRNFVNFADFYSPDRWAIFQAGTLYLDSRSTELCLRVDAVHPLAAMSKAYIAYVDCRRAGAPPMKLAACFTQGDSDYLFVGRNGIFYDRQGRDWDATLTQIVDNPVSIRQAFWSPYKKFVRMIEEQVAKRAAAAEAASSGQLASVAAQAAHADKAVAAPLPKKIDVGTVAALGVAVGAIGGALGAVATGLAQLAFWQLPLVLAALMLVISCPSMIIAWLKLRQRTLGPLLEGNGWAINGRVKINLPFGSKLTELALLPPGSRRSLDDPYEDKSGARRRRLALAMLAILIFVAVAIRVHHTWFNAGAYFWQTKPVSAAPAPASVAPTPLPADAPAAAPKP